MRAIHPFAVPPIVLPILLAALPAALVASPGRAAVEACGPGEAVTAKVAATAKGDPKARDAAQRGLSWLGRAARSWQDQHQCYGCHVQAVTLEAMTVGLSHQYNVDKADMDAIVFGMTDISGGVHGPHGLTVGNAVYLPESSKAFGGAAFAHFDERVSSRLQKELVQTATELLASQQEDGSVKESYVSPPVVSGRLQATTLALVAWRQAFARTADTRWLVPIRKAEAYVTQQAKRMSDGGGDLQEMDHALIALVAAGAGQGDRIVKELARLVEKRQNKDGGFGATAGAASDPFMTGQALYALRNAGRSDGDATIVSGTRWLVAHQRTDGGWSDGGFGKAEAMWAVLGLVSMDKVSIDVAGLVDGAHVEGKATVKVSAADNAGGKVKQLRLFVDDVVKHGACGAGLEATLDAASLSAGAHVIDVVATGADGKESRRRLTVYAGDAYLHELGARFDGAGTVLGFRDIAPDAMKATVKVAIVDDKNKVVHEATLPSVQGPMKARFDGAVRGRYTAKLSLVDAAGKTRDTEELVFTHDTPEAQKARFAEVAGAVNGGKGEALTNTDVELVDEAGRVVQKTKTTRSGQYRFQNVDSGKYKVRVKKDGFTDWEAPLAAEASKEAAAPAATMQAQ